MTRDGVLHDFLPEGLVEHLDVSGLGA